MKLHLHLLTLALAVQAFEVHPEQPSAIHRGRQFIGFESFTNFAASSDFRPEAKTGESQFSSNSSLPDLSSRGERVLTSPDISASIRFNEVVLSWNAETSLAAYLIVEVQALYATNTTRYYTLGEWSTNPGQYPRRSVPDQKDADADVSTDVLVLERPAEHLRVRLRIGGTDSAALNLKFLGVSLADTTASFAPLQPKQGAWGKLLGAPERSQMIYPNGKTLCSPTTVSMLMGYWAEKLKRPELDLGVPQIAEAIYDAQWRGAGNWPFNMAYAGSFRGMRAYVARLSDISELEQWVLRDIPVGLSVDYDRLRAKGPGPNGHLVVCVGFSKTGDPILHDPGTSQHVRKVYPRQNLINAWACSKNTVYLVYPNGTTVPEDRFGHWDSQTSRSGFPSP